jgi:hypothetical protein
LYFHRADDAHVAIVYQVPGTKTKDAAAKLLIEHSVRSLGVGLSAGKQRRLYEQLSKEREHPKKAS